MANILLKCFKLIKNVVIIVFKKKELVEYESDDVCPQISILSKSKHFTKCSLHNYRPLISV